MMNSFLRRLAEERKKMYEESMTERRARVREEEAERARERERLAGKAKQVEEEQRKHDLTNQKTMTTAMTKTTTEPI